VTQPLPPHKQHVLEGLVFVTVFLDLVGFGIVIPLLPFYVQSMGGTSRTVGVLLGCFSFTQVLATPLLGRLSDRHGRKPIILLSLFANAAAMGLFSLASHERALALLFTSRILAGATSGNLSTCQAALADATPPKDRARAMGRMGAGIGLGLVLGPLIGGWLAKGGAWLPPLAAGALALLGALSVLAALPETHPAESRTAQGRRERWPRLPEERKRALGLMLALYFLVFLAMTTMQVALGLLAQARVGWGSSEVGYAFALVGGLGLVIQGALIGPLAKALGEVRLLVTGALVYAGGMLGISVAGHSATLMGAVALLGIGMGLIQPLLSSLASQVAGAERQGAILGLAQSSGGLARTVGPLASGYLYAGLGPGAPFLGASGVAVVAAMLGVLIGREGVGHPRQKKTRAAPEAPGPG